MKTHALKTLSSDNFVVIIALLLAIILFAAGAGKTQQLQQGISVQLATTTGAVSVPEADNRDAWIVTVTDNNNLFFGVDPVTPQRLLAAMKTRPRNRRQDLYIKADGRTAFATVTQVLKVAHADLFDRVILLTSQSESAQPGTIASPKGLDVWITVEAGLVPVTVQIGSEQESTILKVNNETVAPSELQARLGQLFDNRPGRTVVLKAFGQVPYAQVIQTIDAARAAGASRVTLVVSPEV